jgi:hypothetical protein
MSELKKKAKCQICSRIAEGEDVLSADKRYRRFVCYDHIVTHPGSGPFVPTEEQRLRANGTPIGAGNTLPTRPRR